jgi:hypothetical protein
LPARTPPSRLGPLRAKSRRLLRRLTRKRRRVYLHIGAMKSGTTFLQGMLVTNKETLAKDHVLVWGGSLHAQGLAVRDAIFGSEDDPNYGEYAGTWAQLASDVDAHRGPSVVSMEFLSFANPEQAKFIVDSFHRAEVHIILSIRDSAGAVPAQWQTRARSGGKLSYRQVIHGLETLIAGTDARGPGPRLLRRTQDIPRMLETWVPLVGRERVHVITVRPPQGDPLLLWRRFCSILGVDAAKHPLVPIDANPSLGLASVELLRRVNASLGPLGRPSTKFLIKAGLSRYALAPHAGEEPKIQLTKRGLHLAGRWNRKVSAAITSAQVDLVGSLHELPTKHDYAAAPRTPVRVTDQDILAAAAFGWQRMAILHVGLRTLSGLAAEQPLPVPAWDQAERPTDAAVTDLTRLLVEMGDMHVALGGEARRDLSVPKILRASTEGV